MSFKTIKSWLAGLATCALVACGGGGGGDAGTALTGSGSGGSTGGGTSTTGPTVVVALSSATISPANGATLTATVRDASGQPLSGRVVSLSMSRGTLAALSVTSAVTDANGVAQASLSALTAGVSGADEVVATATLGTTTVSGSAAFTVVGSAPAVGLTASATTLKVSQGPATVSATVRDAAGNTVANTAVTFASRGGLVTLTPASVLTNSAGVATALAVPASASVTAADTITASATVNSQAVQSSLPVQLVADQPLITVTPSSSTVTATSPSTLSVMLLDTAGRPASGVVVTVASQFGLSTFNQASAVTNSSGIASIVVSPGSASSNGADQIVASATVGGVTVTRGVVLQISTLASAALPTLRTVLSSTAISSASPATVTATLTDGNGSAVAGQVVTFTVVRGLAKTNIGTALTDTNGRAVVVLTPVNSTSAGADEVSAAASFAGTSLSTSVGFQIQATNVNLTSFSSAIAQLGPYAQTTLTLALSGASVGSPVNVSVSSACVTLGKATLSPSSFTTTSNAVTLQYKDNGCGALQTADKLQAAIVGASGSLSLDLPITSPTATSLAFVTASPEVIFIKGSGFTESSTLTFEVRDAAGNILPNRQVLLKLLTEAGGVTLQGGTRPSAGEPLQVTQQSDSAGRVAVLVNAGTQPTPIRVSAALADNTTVATVSSNLSVAVGLPSQLNFSLSPTTLNIEGMNIDGTANTYNIIASDRNGNPVPVGTSINFVTEGGQIESIARIQSVNGSARATARFISANPRPADGRVTITAFTLGEESFIDQNGNNTYDAGEPFQDLGRVFKDRLYDGSYDPVLDEYVPTQIDDASACLLPSASGPAFNGTVGVNATTTALLTLDASIPSIGGSTCDSKWSGAGKVYVRRAVETVLATSVARPLWSSKSGLDASCSGLTLQIGPQTASTAVFTPVLGGETWYTSASSTTLPFIVADRNTFPALSNAGAVGRLNPMASGTTVSASTPTTGVTLTVGGSSVPNTTEASSSGIGVTFAPGVTFGVVFVTFTSPSGTGTTYAINVQQTGGGVTKPSNCP